ncbi:hypothetical protein N431DRAFT_328018 [Stipitochalara longipes BDJ]|nr:hypothetical protein N431DRAFT_328018 [Stipitochalara longipes BDJ]
MHLTKLSPSTQGYGICESTTYCTNNYGKTYTGFCPDAGKSILCCVNPDCYSPYSNAGLCEYTASPNGKSCSGYCPGPSDYECCVFTD